MGKNSVVITFHESPVHRHGTSISSQLPDLTFRVRKHFRITTEMRELKLSKEGIENIKDGIATSIHGYGDVKRLRLKDMQHILIEYFSTHDYHYESENAMEIIQEICNRVNTQAFARKPDLQAPEIPMEYQKHLAVRRPYRTISDTPASVEKSMRPRSLTTEHPPYRPSKLDRLTGTDATQRLSLAIDKTLLDASTPEGRTIQKFVSNYRILEKNAEAVCTNIRQFLDGMKEHMTSEYTPVLKHLTEGDVTGQQAIPERIEFCLERAVLSPLMDKVLNLLDTNPTIREQERMFAVNMNILTEKPQSFFEIKYPSPTSFGEAVKELKLLGTVALPQAKMNVILSAVRSIYGLVNVEQNMGKTGEFVKQIFLAADDFLPILIFVIVHSQLPHLVRTCEFLSRLCDSSVLNGEGGYYLTAFCSAVQYVTGLDPQTLGARAHI